MTRVSGYASLLLLALVALPAFAQPAGTDIFAPDNLMAWCIVPFDTAKRGPQARAEMLARMGIKKLAYDWRAEHIPTFDDEIKALRKHGVTLQAFWFPATLDEEARIILDVLKRNEVQTELWITMNGGDIVCTPAEHASRVADHAEAIRSISEAAAQQGCTIGLYNHGGWFGEPRNQIEIIETLSKEGFDNIGIVYNQHHGHGHIDAFADLLHEMVPYLYAINLNGMERDGDTTGRKILPIGSGSLDEELIGIVRDSGYRGPIGILNHTDGDAEVVLLENLSGLDRVVAKIPEDSTVTR